MREWNTEHTDDTGSKARLIGIMFNTKDKRVQETWKWTEPPKCPSMDRVLRMMVMRKDAGKGKAKARGNNAKGKGKTREGKGKASAGKGKGKK